MADVAVVAKPGPIYHPDLVQGCDEWHAIRCGRLTASEMCRIITPTLKIASNDKSRAHDFELLAQRITGRVEPAYISDDMLRGREDEVMARYTYHEKYAPVVECGFVTNDRWGFTIGYSPDGLVGRPGQIECKSRRQRFQVETILNHADPHEACAEYMIQIQTGLLVTERAWCDFISYSAGLPMVTIRVEPDPTIQDAIVEAAAAFEKRLAEKMLAFGSAMISGARLIPTEYRVEQEIITT